MTFSPAIDYVVDLDLFEIGEINRTKKENMMPGGKGINVSIVLANLGMKSVATGFMGGFTGRFIQDELNKKNIASDFVEVEGNTRINVKIRCKGETAINGQGPDIPDCKIEELIKKLEKLNQDDLLVISGSVPSKLPSNIYEMILARIGKNGVKLIVDAEKDILLNTLKYHPILVKPNRQELEEMFKVKLKDNDELIQYANKLLDMGAENAIVSLGKEGALVVGKGVKPLIKKSPGYDRKVVNTVGAGDSLVAGFIDEYYRSGDVIKAFKMGMSTGSATALSEGLAEKELVLELLKEMED